MRIVSLLPSATEIVYALGAGDELVGVTHECDYPPQARSKTALTASSLPPASTADAAAIDRHVRERLHAGSSIYSLDAALLAQLEPDLIITQELCPVCAVSYEQVGTAIKRLRTDPRLVALEPSSLEDVYRTIESIGELIDRRDAARRLVAGLQVRERALRACAAQVEEPLPRVLVLEWTDPPMGGGHWTPGLVELAGGDPVLAHRGADSQRLEWDAIAAADPDVIIVAPCGFDLNAALRAVRALADLPQWRSLRAVRGGRVAVVDGNAYVNRPGPRLIDSAEIFAAAIHPQLAALLPRYDDGWTMPARV
ncbi:MAG: cobalamin-binding protein [Candidatus Eremiobacteraeota bacterium]|nr:cobalamin-binding protein [Candidatus Eremiobacteraeota bacterium]